MAYKPLIAENSQLMLNRYHSNLSADVASGVSEIELYSISQFAVNLVLCVGEIGNEGTEIILTHASTAPATNTVTLASNLTKPHPKDTPVYILAFNQIEFYHATTPTGGKSQLSSAVNIDPEKSQMIYEDTTYTSGYYYTRYKNSITSNYSEYSDPVPYSGFEENTVGYAIDTALSELNQDLNEKLTYNMLISWTNQMLRLVRGKLKAWSNFQKFDEEIGNMEMGVRRFAMPTDIYEKNSNKSVLNVRIGNSYPLDFIDRSEYLQGTEDATYTEVAEAAVPGQTYLILNDTSDFDDSGSVTLYISGVKYTIEYTSNVKVSSSISPSLSRSISPSISPSSSASASVSPSTSPSSSPSGSASPSASPSVSPSVSTPDTLIVASDQITVNIPAGTPVWQGVEEGSPRYYSIWDGYIYIWPMITSDYNDQRLIMDYYTDIDTVDSDSDVITGPRFDMLIHYLKFKIRAVTKNNGREDLTDPSYISYAEILRDAIRLEELGQINTFRPRASAVYGGRARGRR